MFQLPFVIVGLSWVIGVAVCFYRLHRARARRTVARSAAMFGVGPFVALALLYLVPAFEMLHFEDDLAYMHALCEKSAGDSIHRTVEGVQGVMQIRQRYPGPDDRWGEQFGMDDPWAQAFGDSTNLGSYLGLRGTGYWFIEQQPEYGRPLGPPYRRTHLVFTGKTVAKERPFAPNATGPAVRVESREVPSTLARYGYTTEDVTTLAMRLRWIGGGRLKVVDLQTGEVLAERVDYFRATGPGKRLAWSAGTSCPDDSKWRVKTASIVNFVMAVLKPPQAIPTPAELSLIEGK
jgi:hypothetical protein